MASEVSSKLIHFVIMNVDNIKFKKISNEQIERININKVMYNK